jgi:hypothetical protein
MLSPLPWLARLNCCYKPLYPFIITMCQLHWNYCHPFFFYCTRSRWPSLSLSLSFIFSLIFPALSLFLSLLSVTPLPRGFSILLRRDCIHTSPGQRAQFWSIFSLFLSFVLHCLQLYASILEILFCKAAHGFLNFDNSNLLELLYE